MCRVRGICQYVMCLDMSCLGIRQLPPCPETRPIRYAPGEVNGFADRARYMAKTAEASLADKVLGAEDPLAKPGFRRFIRREPLGVVLVIPAWNYPYLTAVNGIVPAILSGTCVWVWVGVSVYGCWVCADSLGVSPRSSIGNTVVLKHSQQTPLCAERIAEAFQAAGLPEGVFQVRSFVVEERLVIAADRWYSLDLLHRS